MGYNTYAMCINLCWEWRDRLKPDILRSEGGGELTPVEVPRSSNSMVYLKRLRPVKYDCSYYFVTRRRLVGEDGCDSFESRVIDSKTYPE